MAYLKTRTQVLESHNIFSTRNRGFWSFVDKKRGVVVMQVWEDQAAYRKSGAVKYKMLDYGWRKRTDGCKSMGYYSAIKDLYLVKNEHYTLYLLIAKADDINAAPRTCSNYRKDLVKVDEYVFKNQNHYALVL